MNSPTATSPTNESRFALILASIWAIATVPRLLTHELWRDEAWLWLVTLDSRSIGDLLQPLGRSGQGYLFPFLCFVARQFSESPRAMQLVHLLVGGCAAYVLARWAPFSRLERVLLLLGYFTFYEYAVISRHYAVGMLCLWLMCVAARNQRSPILLGVAFGLACQTTVYAFIVGVAIVCGWSFDRWLRRRELEPLPLRDAVIGASLGIAGAIAGLVQLMPSEGTSFAPGWRFDWHAGHAVKVLRMPWRAIVPLPHFEPQFWNSNIIDGWRSLEAAAGIAILVLALLLVARNRVSLVTFSTGAGAILLFGYVKIVGEMRHGGHLWIALVAAIWLGGGLAATARPGRWRSNVFLVLLLAHCAAAGFASWIDLRHPFTMAPATAAMLRDDGLDRLPLLGHREPPAASVALALGRPLYSPSRGVFAKYPDWGPKQREMPDPELRCVARALSRREHSDIVMVINRELPAWGELEPAGERLGAIAKTENYHLYRLRLDRIPLTDGDAACAGSAR